MANTEKARQNKIENTQQLLELAAAKKKVSLIEKDLKEARQKASLYEAGSKKFRDLLKTALTLLKLKAEHNGADPAGTAEFLASPEVADIVKELLVPIEVKLQLNVASTPEVKS
jgi:hypothetical protein